ncbi:hypothetical protein HF086_004866 [Spodoptera exigua]|uniref:Uncharacterized protein n=1 Tax=Spodoptera exigua TaxID=7107 RepID=A0A922M4T5_SPOEX|nr:hypothetical protein HF086_004866 [Spodoptera exigua]
MRFKMKFNSIKRLLPLYSSLLLTIFISVVSPGGKFMNNFIYWLLNVFMDCRLYIILQIVTANDLHFHDGVSTADIIYGDVFFEILDPPELRYSYRIRPAKDFGTPFNESIQFHDARMDLDVNIPAAYLLGRSGTTILRTLRKLKKDYAIVNLPINLTHVPIGKMNQPPWISW